jgi:hypothetical protein
MDVCFDTLNVRHVRSFIQFILVITCIHKIDSMINSE